MSDESACAREHSGMAGRRLLGLRSMALLLCVACVGACASDDKPAPGRVQGAGQPLKIARAAPNLPISKVDVFWSGADASISNAQRDMRSARLAARQLGGEVAKADYDQIIDFGHLLGGFGHDHLVPSDNPPVIPMLDAMVGTIESLIRLATTDEELKEASEATDATVGKLSLRTQRLYHLLSAKRKVVGVRDQASALGFAVRPAGTKA